MIYAVRIRIPKSTTFRFFWLGIATLVLLIIWVIEIYLANLPQFVIALQGITGDLFLLFLLFYLVMESFNILTQRRFDSDSYSFDGTAIYRNSLILIPWLEVSSVAFRKNKDKESFLMKTNRANISVINKGTTFSPVYVSLGKYPEVTEKVKRSTIVITPNVRLQGAAKPIVIPTTTFSPLFKRVYSRMQQIANSSGVQITFHYN